MNLIPPKLNELEVKNNRKLSDAQVKVLLLAYVDNPDMVFVSGLTSWNYDNFTGKGSNNWTSTLHTINTAKSLHRHGYFREHSKFKDVYFLTEEGITLAKELSK